MDVLVVADGKYIRTPDGKVYVESVFNYDFYKRYLQVFDKVYAIAYISNQDFIPTSMQQANGEGVEFLELPPYTGKNYIRNYFRIVECSRKYARRFDCAIFRLPGIAANILSKAFSRTGKPFAIEVVVDPWEYFSPGTSKKLSRPLIRYTWSQLLKKMCTHANGVSYVTKHYLQEKYPCRALLEGESQYFFTSSYSSANIPMESIGNARSYYGKEHFIITHIANSFSSYGKGHLTLMSALKKVREKGYNVDVVFIGDGPLRNEFEEYAKSLRIFDSVVFTGRLASGAAVREVLSESDLFVFPTMAEGLPRVLLEAMAVGLPCISTPVCGIPEILSKEFLVKPNDEVELAKKIIELVSTPSLMEEQSMLNIRIAKDFTEDTLETRRVEFYKKLFNIALKNRKTY